MRLHISARRAPALAVLLRHLIAAEAFMVLGIEVVAGAELRLLRGLQEYSPYWIFRAQPVDVQRSLLAVIVAVEIGVVLRALEIGQHICERPAGVAERGPVVVVPAVAADVDHRVDGGGAAKPLAARLIADTAVEARLRHGFEGPVGALVLQGERERRGHPPAVIGAAGIERSEE